MSKSLFEEAIADARMLREAAEQNAKNAIIEAVTPRIREFIENQLVGGTLSNENSDFLSSALNEDEEKSDDDNIEEIELDESALKSLVTLVGGKNTNRDGEVVALSEAFDSLTEDEQNRLMKILREEDSSSEKTEDQAYEIDLDEIRSAVVSEIQTKKNGEKNPMNKHEMKKKGTEEDLYEIDEMGLYEEDEEDDEEMGLDEATLKFLVKSGEIDQSVLDALSGLDIEDITAEFTEGEGESEDEDVEVGAEAPEGADTAGEEAEAPAVKEAVYEIDENMLRLELARLREAKARKKSKGSSSPSHRIAAAAFGGGTLESDALEVELNKGKTALMKEARENRALRSQLNDYRGAVETLREQLSDLNLFNAKLLYVNKILQNKDVAPNQRRAIIEALDGASNLREAKLLFESLSTSITSKNQSLNESVKHTAGLASRPVSSASARMSGAGEVDRWAILAGIK